MANPDSHAERGRVRRAAPKAARRRGVLLRLLDFVDGYAPEADPEDPRRRQRGLMMARIAFLGAGMSLLLAPVFWFSHSRAPQIAVLNVVYAGVLLTCPLFLLRTRSSELGAHWLLTFAFSILVYETILLGGVASSAFHWLIALPFGAALFGGRRCAAIWGYTTGLAIVTLVALELHGVVGDGSTDVSEVANRGLSVAVLALMIGHFGWLQEREIDGLIDHLQDERVHYRLAATRDPLTGLLNRSTLTDHLARTLARTRRVGTCAALYYGDLDGFKAINDHWGHFVGDLLLKAVAERLRTETRASDIAMRVGGDEFVLIVEQIEDPRAAAIVAEKVVELVQRPVEIEGQTVSVGMSFGIVMIEGQAARPDQLLDLADAAMYAAKRSGRPYAFA